MSAPIKAAFKVSNGLAPQRDYPQAMPIVLTMAANVAQTVDLQVEENQGILSTPQTIFVDNSANAAALSITSTITNQKLVIPASKQAYLPILMADGSNLVFVTTGSGLISAQLLDVPMPACVWG